MRVVIDKKFWLRFALLACISILSVILTAVLAFPAPANLKEMAQQTAREFDRLLQLRQQQVFTFATFPSVRAFAASTPETRSQRAAVTLNELQAWVASDAAVREALIVDKNGLVIMTTLEGWGTDWSGREFVKAAMAGQLAASPIVNERGEFSTMYAAPILNNEKEIAGALISRVAAQELYGVTPRGENFYTVLADENGARLDDTGDPARRLETFAPLDAARAAQIMQNQTYGAQLPRLRAGNLDRAQDLITRGKPDQLTPADLDASAFAARRLVTKPWTVLIVAPKSEVTDTLRRLALPIVGALLLALGGTFLLTRL